MDDGAEALVSAPVLFDAASFIVSWMGNSQPITALRVATSTDGNMTIEYGTPIENNYSGKHVSLNSIIVDKYYDYSPSIVFTADNRADEWIRNWFGLSGSGKYSMDCEFGKVNIGEFGYKLVFENGELYQAPIIHEGAKINVYYTENGETRLVFDAANILRNTKLKLSDKEAEKVKKQLEDNGYIIYNYFLCLFYGLWRDIMDLIVSDEYVLSSADNSKNNLELLNAIVSEYIESVEMIKNTVFQHGETAEALQAFINYATLLKNNLYGIGTNTKNLFTNFNLEIDNADQFLF